MEGDGFGRRWGGESFGGWGDYDFYLFGDLFDVWFKGASEKLLKKCLVSALIHFLTYISWRPLSWYQIHVDFKTAEFRRSLRNYPIPDPPLVVAKNIWPKYIKHRNIAKNLARSNDFIFKQIDGTKVVDYTLAGIIQDVAVNEHR